MNARPEIQISNRSGFELDTEDLAAVAAAALVELGLARGELGVTFVGDEEISRLNLDFLGHEGPTDVISFPLDEEGSGQEDPAIPMLLGDLVISPATARENSSAYGVSFEEELCRLVIHGVLHVAGYDHERDNGEMMSRQEELVAAYCGKHRPA